MKLTELNQNMNDDQRFALHFGPYHAPPFHYGDVVMDEVRGEVTVVKLSDAKIPWPIGKLRQGRSLIMYGGLADAIRRESNQAVCHWWGITPQTVIKWRKVLKVEPLNAGSRELFVRYGCLDIRRTGIGANGIPVLFNRKPKKTDAAKLKADRPAKGEPDPAIELLLDALKGLGLSPAPQVVMEAIAALYPTGIAGQDQGDVIRKTFLHLQGKRQ